MSTARGSYTVTLAEPWDVCQFSLGMRIEVVRYGASRETLLRRVQYGGRKGRRAAKRLKGMPAPGYCTVTSIGGWTYAL